MPYKKLSVIGASIILLCIGCAVTTVFYPETYSYSGDKKEPTLVIYFIDPLLRIDYFPAEKDEFGKGDQNVLIQSFFRERLLKDIDSLTIFKNALFDKLASDLVTEELPVKVPAHGELMFDIPVNTSKVEFQQTEADFVLFLDEVSIESNYQVSESDSFEPVYNPYTGNLMRNRNPAIIRISKDLTFESKFILWDNNKRVPVSYGYVRATKENKKKVSRQDWLKVSKMHVKKLFEGTPFLLTQNPISKS